MEFIAPIPFAEAIRKLGDQSVVGSTFTSSEWSDLPVELRDNAFFSSRIESAQFLQRAQDALGDFVAGNRKTLDNGETMLATGSRAAFVSQMQDFLTQNGAVRGGGGLTDTTSEKRLGLIFDIKTRQAQDFGYWLQGMDPDVLNEFPAMRFIRVIDVKEPRLNHAPHEDQVYLKTDPIWWLVINKDFGVPWGPWGWGCGHDVEDVDRTEAEQLGLLAPGEKLNLAPLQRFLKLNQNLQASTKNLAPELVDKLKKEFGDKIVLDGDTMKWKAKPSPNEPAPAVVPTTERKAPVSAGLEVKVRGDLKLQVDAALQAIDEVHDDGALPQIPLKSTTRRYLGYMQPVLQNGQVRASYLAVRADGSWPALTAVHEIGHYLDLEAIGNKGSYATESFDLMRDVLTAARQTEAVKEIVARHSANPNERDEYLMGAREIWARAYAQFIASRTNDPLLQRQLADAIAAGHNRQWSPADFAALDKAIEKLFVTLGWI